MKEKGKREKKTGQKNYFIFVALSLELVTYVLIGVFFGGKIDGFLTIGKGFGVPFTLLFFFCLWIFHAFFILKKFWK